MAAEYLDRMGTRIRERRKELGLSRSAVARLMPGKTTENAIYRWETGKHRPQDDTLEALARVLQVSGAAYFLAPEPDKAAPLPEPFAAEETDLRRIEEKLDRLLTALDISEDPKPAEFLQAIRDGATGAAARRGR